MRSLLAFLPLTAMFLLVAPSAMAAPFTWAGQVVETDTYTPNNPIYNVHTSCTSTAGVGVLVHANGQWRFATYGHECIGYDVRFNDDQCTTDSEGTLDCYYSDPPTGCCAEHWMTFEPDGDFYTEYLSFGSFAGDNYVITGNLAPIV